MKIINSLYRILNSSDNNLSIENSDYLSNIGATNCTPLPCRMNDDNMHDVPISMGGYKLPPLITSPREEQINTINERIKELRTTKNMMETTLADPSTSKQAQNHLREQIQECDKTYAALQESLNTLNNDRETEKQIRAANTQK